MKRATILTVMFYLATVVVVIKPSVWAFLVQVILSIASIVAWKRIAGLTKHG